MSTFTRRCLLAAALAFAAACFVSPVSASAPHREKVIITLRRRNAYFLDGKQVTKEQIEPLLAARVRKSPLLVAVIRADKHQTFGRVSELISLAKQAGVRSVMIADPATAPPRK